MSVKRDSIVAEAIKKRENELIRRENMAKAKEYGIFDFGEELYNNGYDFDDIVADIITCYITSKEKEDNFYASLQVKYGKITNFPSLEIMRKLATNTYYLESLTNGYKRGERLAYIANGTTNKKK